MSNRRNSETAVMEKYRVALDNCTSQADIAKAMQELGYNKNVIAEGRAILQETRAIFDKHKKEGDEATQAYITYNDKRDALDDLYRLHRKKAKVIFRKDEAVLKELLLDGAIPKAYIRWIELIKKFYTTVAREKTIQQQLNRLKVTTVEITAGIKLIAELENARSEYIKEKGESEDATQLKDESFDKIDNWMSDFFAVARIALDDRPQLLEVLSIIVKS